MGFGDYCGGTLNQNERFDYTFGCEQWREKLAFTKRWLQVRTHGHARVSHLQAGNTPHTAAAAPHVPFPDCAAVCLGGLCLLQAQQCCLMRDALMPTSWWAAPARAATSLAARGSLQSRCRRVP